MILENRIQIILSIVKFTVDCNLFFTDIFLSLKRETKFSIFEIGLYNLKFNTLLFNLNFKVGIASVEDFPKLVKRNSF